MTSRKFDRLVCDINHSIHSHDPELVTTDTARNAIDLAKRIATHSLDLLKRETWGPKAATDRKIRFSELGNPCIRQLMYKWYMPSLANPPYAEPDDAFLPIKFTYGDYIEELVFFLAKEAGHEVRDRQKKVDKRFPGTTWYVEGSIDGYIDDVLVDVKSAADVSFKKYKAVGLDEGSDSFGYRWQLDGYSFAENTTERAFIFVNKHDGHMHIQDRSGLDLMEIETRVKEIGHHAAVGQATKMLSLPDRLGTKVTANGNELPTVCSYCKFKYECYDGNIEGYISSGRPIYFVDKTKKGEEFVKTKTKIPKPEAY